jgi:predicted outer membrane protein/sporulation protein YlmC with PRC-barrel domain
MKTIWILAATALVTPSIAMGQSSTPTHTQAQADQPRPGEAIPASDFVAKAAIGSMFEIQSSELVKDRTRNEQVRQFADRMIRDHRAASDRLKAVSGNQTVPANLDQQHQKTLEQVRSANDDRIDRVYIDLQVQAHKDAVAMFDRYGQTGDDPRLKQFAQQTLPNLREHLQAAEQIQARLQPDRVGAAQGDATGRSSATAQGATEPSRIVVQQTAPTVQVDQASPRVTVQQAQPSVTVRQPQPEIIVRQPQPTVTIDIPQPEIVVRMPNPDVNVAMAQPEVQVDQPAPQVRVAEPQSQPRVQVERGNPQVRVEQPEGAEPRVNVQRADGQPNVRYERAEPRVVVNQAQGQPKVRYERSTEAQADARDRVPTDPSRMTPAQMRERAEVTGERANEPGRTTTATTTGATPATGAGAAGSAVTASQLTSMNLYNARGNELGDVERVVGDADGRTYVVVGAGGFLGIGERNVAISLDQVAIQGDRLIIRGVTEDQIKAMPAFDRNDRRFREVAGNQRIQIGSPQ